MASNTKYGELRYEQPCLNQEKDIRYRIVYEKTHCKEGAGSNTTVTDSTTLTAAQVVHLPIILVNTTGVSQTVTLPSGATTVAQVPEYTKGSMVSCAVLHNYSGNAVTLAKVGSDVLVPSSATSIAAGSAVKISFNQRADNTVNWFVSTA
jgi:hypothetical protein